MTDRRYHVKFVDEASGEGLGLMLVGPPLDYSRRLTNPYAAKAGQGATEDSDLTEWSVVSQRDWRGGRGQERFEEEAAYYDARGLETRIEGQLTLGPLPINPTGTPPRYEPGDAAAYWLGWPGPDGRVAELRGGEVLHTFDREIYSGSSYTWGSVASTSRWDPDPRWIKSLEFWVKKESGTSGYIRVALHEDDDGAVGDELQHVDVDASGVATSFGKITFALDSAEEMTVDTRVWVVLSSDASEGAPFTLAVRQVILMEPQRIYLVHWEKVARSMSFTAPSGGMTCNDVYLYLRRIREPGTFTAKLCQNNAGEPGTVMTSKAVDLDAALEYNTYTWVRVTWDSGQALDSETLYHIVLEAPSEEASHRAGYAEWGGCAAGGYGSGASNRQVASEGWEGQTEDLYFRVDETELDGAPVAFARFDGDWYCAAGDRVYVWNEGTGEWDTSDEVSGKDVTDLAVWGDYLWAARGDDNVVRRTDGESWGDAPGSIKATLLKAGGGYLQRSGAGSDAHRAWYTADGTTWVEIEGTPADYPITAMEWYRDMLVVTTTVRLWGTVDDMAYPLLDYHSQEDADNGKGMLAWSRTGCLYIPLQFGLYRYNGDTMVAVGPEQGMGLPGDRAGKVAALVGTGNWLFAAIDAGDSGHSSVMAYNGMGGWHELQRCEEAGQRIRALGFETVHSPSRLWLGLDVQTRYLQLPDYTDNPYGWTGYEFNPDGEVESSWFGGELVEVVKDLHEVVVRGENISSGRPVAIYYEVDRSGLWQYLGQVVAGPRQVLGFEAAEFSAKQVGTGSTQTTIELASGYDTADMAVGDFVRINGEVSQVAGVTDSDTFTLHTALGEAPEAEDVVYAARPAGREFRLKAVLSTDDRTETPRVTALAVRYQNNVLDRFIFVLAIRAEDGLVDLDNKAIGRKAASLREELDAWAERVTPFTLVDPDGREWTVKAVAASDAGYELVKGEAGQVQYSSVYRMNLVEV